MEYQLIWWKIGFCLWYQSNITAGRSKTIVIPIHIAIVFKKSVIVSVCYSLPDKIKYLECHVNFPNSWNHTCKINWGRRWILDIYLVYYMNEEDPSIYFNLALCNKIIIYMYIFISIYLFYKSCMFDVFLNMCGICYFYQITNEPFY